MPKDHTCPTCLHYSPRKSVGNTWGECRIRRPDICRRDGNGSILGPSDAHWGVWPAVNGDDWCGEHSLVKAPS